MVRNEKQIFGRIGISYRAGRGGGIFINNIQEERREEEERNALRKKKKQTSQEEKSDNKQSNENPEKVNVDSTTTDINELSSEVKKEDL